MKIKTSVIERLLNLINRHTGHLSLKSKIIISYILLVLMPALCLGYFFYVKSSRLIETEVTDSFLQALTQTEMNLSYRLENIRDISNMAFMNTSLQQCLSRSPEEETVGSEMEDANELRKLLSGLQDQKDILRIRLYVEERKLYSGERVNFFPLSDLNNSQWYREVAAANGSPMWSGTSSVKYTSREQGQVITCARILRHAQDYGKIVGILAIDIPESILYRTISGISIKKDNVFIIDRDGQVISHINKEMIGEAVLDKKIMDSMEGNAEGILKQKDSGRNDLIIYRTIPATGWKLVAQIAAEDINGGNARFTLASTLIVIIASVFVFLIIILLIFAFAAGSYDRRIKTMLRYLEVQGIENIQGVLGGKRGEIYQLEENIGKMAVTIRQLTEESFRVKMSEREAQLKALQAQINPHFLYNALDAINWMAVRQNAGNISRMINSLAKYFRLSLSKGRDIVSVEDELMLAEVYLHIQRTRYPEKFEYQMDKIEGIHLLCIPKLTLQPIVENALLHGILKQRERKGFIHIRVEAGDDFLRITVADNGKGMDQDRMAKVLLPEENSNRESYGLYNVNERIKLFFGEDACIRISSQVDQGTEVELHVRKKPFPL